MSSDIKTSFAERMSSMGKKKKKDKTDRISSDVEFYNDQLGENPAEERIVKEHDKKERKHEH